MLAEHARDDAAARRTVDLLHEQERELHEIARSHCRGLEVANDVRQGQLELLDCRRRDLSVLAHPDLPREHQVPAPRRQLDLMRVGPNRRVNGTGVAGCCWGAHARRYHQKPSRPDAARSALVTVVTASPCGGRTDWNDRGPAEAGPRDNGAKRRAPAY